MTESDDALQGVLITGFAIAGLSFLGWCLRKKKSQMTKSASTEELSSVSTDDPQT